MDIITIRTRCFGSLVETKHELDYQEHLSTDVNKILYDIGLKCGGNIDGRHIAELLYKDLGADKIGSLTMNKLELSMGANCMVTPCPFCYLQYDLTQKGTELSIPVLHISQLPCPAMGVERVNWDLIAIQCLWDIKWNDYFVATTSLNSKWGIEAFTNKNVEREYGGFSC